MVDDTDDSIPQVFQIGTPDVRAFVELILRDHEHEIVSRSTQDKPYVRCRCTPQVFRTMNEQREHVAAIITQKLDDLYHAWRERNASEN